MKPLILFPFLLLAFLLSISGCRKHSLDRDGLPPATKEGERTLGFLLNGKPWMPHGFNGTANLSLDYEPGFRNGIFGIAAYRLLDGKESFTIGVRDSLNYMSIPCTLDIGKNTLASMSFTNANCDFFTRDGLTFCDGSLTITKVETRTASAIVSGRFEATLYKPGCDTIHITKGRFDMALP